MQYHFAIESSAAQYILAGSAIMQHLTSTLFNIQHISSHFFASGRRNLKSRFISCLKLKGING